MQVRFVELHRTQSLSYLGLCVVERQHAVVVSVLGLDVCAVGGGRAAELAELRHGVPVPGVHVGGRGRRVVVRVEHVDGMAAVVGTIGAVKDFGPASGITPFQPC